MSSRFERHSEMKSRKHLKELHNERPIYRDSEKYRGKGNDIEDLRSKLKREKFKKPHDVKYDKTDGRRHISPMLARRKGMHRNSPVELINRGCRNTDSSSSESEFGNLNHKNHHHSHHRKKRYSDEESYEELSRKKKKIESELIALEEEEEAAAERERMHDGHKKNLRNQSYNNRRKNFNSGGRSVKQENVARSIKQESAARSIKQEHVSDDDNYRRPRRNGRAERNSGGNQEWGKRNASDTKNVKEKEKPNFEVSGKLAEDTNVYNGVVIKYNEPKDARKAKRKWRLYPFKGDTSLPFIPVHRQSAYLFGRTRLVADIPIDHPSCSKQHAVLQFRLIDYKREDGTSGKRVRPYIIDLESSNGTFVNNKKIEPRRYVELLEKDVMKFGFSTREYVVLHEESKHEEEDDDVMEDKS